MRELWAPKGYAPDRPMSDRKILGTWEFTADEMEIMGLRTGDVLGPGVVGFATDDNGSEDLT